MFEGVVATLLNRFLGNYVTNLETNQLKLGIWQGDVKLEKLRLKQDALDKLRLPVDIKEGWLGTLTISIPWSNLKGEPVRIHIDDVYVLATPCFQEKFDPDREEEREYKRKMRKLENDELMHMQRLNKQSHADGEQKKQASFTEQLVTKIVDNLQIVIKNIHVRYEDNISNPDHMFAIGATLGELSAVSTDEEWKQAFLHDSGSVIRKMLKLARFSMYWDTGCETLQGLDHESFIRRFSEAIRNPDRQQPILQPVVGMGKLTMNKRPTPEDVRTMAKFEFDQLAFELDDQQYADALLLTASFDYAMRQRCYRKHRPPPGVRPKDDPRAWLLFAMNSVYDEVHDRNHRRTWEFLKERRDDRLLYIRLYTTFKVNHGVLPEVDATALEQLHRKLSYQDIRFYRARAEPAIRKQRYLIRKRESEVQKTNAGGAGGGNAGSKDAGAANAGIAGWVGGWVSSWVTGAQPAQQQGQGSSSEKVDQSGSRVEGMLNDDEDVQLDEKQVQELYDTIEFDEDNVEDASYDLPKETIKLAVTAILRSGSLRLKVDRKTRDHTLMGFLFSDLKVDLLQRPQNIVADVSMHGFEVVDGTLPNTQYPRMIYVQSDDCDVPIDEQPSSGDDAMATAITDALGSLAVDNDADTACDTCSSHSSSLMLSRRSKIQDPFLQIHFEKDPLDGHADSVVNVKVKSLNVIFHPTAARAIIDFFELPSSASTESIHALIAAASKSVAGFRDQTRAGLEYALSKHKTIDVKVDFDAPVIVFPQNILDPHGEVVVLDTGYLAIKSQLVDSETSERLRQKENHVLNAEEMADLESLMYDHFDMRLYNTQLLVGKDLETCMKALKDGVSNTALHVVDRIELNFDLGLCILSDPPPHMPKVTIDGSLPSLQVYFSDRKYKAIMGSIDLILEAIEDDEVDITQQYESGNAPAAFGTGRTFLKDGQNPNDLSDSDVLLPSDGGQQNIDYEDTEKDHSDAKSDAGSADEFYETTDKVDDTQNIGGGGGGGVLRRKEDHGLQPDAGKEPERVLVKVNFAIDNLVGFVWRTHTDGREDLHIADIAVTGLAVECINRPFDLFADVTIHQVTIEDHLLHSGSGSNDSHVFALTSDIAQADSNGETDKNLVVVKYHRCQADHPEFTTTYESIGQTVDVDISYLDLMVVRKTILTSYDYILKTFTDEPSAQDSAAKKQTGSKPDNHPADTSLSANDQSSSSSDNVSSLIQQALDTIRVDVHFKGTGFSLCHDDGSPIAVLSVTEAMMRVIVTSEVLVEAKVGNITLTDQLDLAPTYLQQQRHQHEPLDPRRLLLYIKGDELADLRYETFDPDSLNYPGHNASVKLRLGAAHLMFIERPIRELMLFGSRFSAMHGLFEAARQAAANGTSQLTEEMMGGNQKYHFDVVMSAPVITFPRDGFVPYMNHPDGTSPGGLGVDVLVAQPGELTILNEFTTVREMGQIWDVNHVSLMLRRIGIKTVFIVDDDTSDHGTFGQAGEQELQILEDVDYNMDMHILMKGHIPGCPRPVTELIGILSPIKMKLTEYQYKMVYDLLMVIARVFGNDPNAPEIPDPLIGDEILDLDILRENPAVKEAQNTKQALANLGQISHASTEDSQASGQIENSGQFATVDLYVTLTTIQLELFKGSGFNVDRIQKMSFTRMDINDLSVKYRSKQNGDSKAELAIVAVRAYDTRPGTENQFTQIISPTITTAQSHGSPSGSAQGRGESSASGQAQQGNSSNNNESMHALAQDVPIEEDSSSPQLICHIDMRPNQDMVVLLTLDSPRIILVLDHAFMLMGFATSVFPQQPDNTQTSAQPVRSLDKDRSQKSASPAAAATATAGAATKENSPPSTGGLIYKVDIIHPEFILLANPQSRSSEALILSINQIVLAQEGMFCATLDEIGVSLCTIDRRQETTRNVMDPFTIITTMDTREIPADPHRGTQRSHATDISIDVGSLLLRLGINDVILMLDIFNVAMEIMYKKDDDNSANSASPSKMVPDHMQSVSMHHTESCALPATGSFNEAGTSTAGASVAASAPASLHRSASKQTSTRGSPAVTSGTSAYIIKETMRATVASLRIVVIRDMFGLPVYACTAKEFHIDIADWSYSMRVQSDLRLQASYFNRRNSHWEPFIEPWGFSLNVASSLTESLGENLQKIDITSSDRLLVNASHAFIEETLGLIAQWGDEMEKHQKHQQQGSKPIGERMPYVLINRTGIDCHVWVDLPEGATARSERIDTTPVLLRDGESLPWRFEDWRRRREQLEVKSHHLGIQFANGQWEWLRRVQVDREGVKHYTLVPAIDDINHRLAVDVKLDAVNLVKRVVLRSPLVVENQTRVAMEVAMCDYRGELRTDSAVIQPGEDLPLPIMFCHQYAVRVRPESGFGYAWSSQYVFWRDFLAQEARPELCCLPQAVAQSVQRQGSGAALSSDVMPFYVHFNALCDLRNPALYKYPFMRLVMTPPMEIENLLPYAMQLCVIDKTANRRWVSPLQRGGIAPVHAVQPGHLILLTIRIPEAGFEKCEGTIIETNDDDEYPTDDDLVMTDNQGIKLALKLHRMDIPNSGGRCRRISIYAPYVMVNRTGLKLFYSSKGFFKGVSAVAGQNLSSNMPLPPADPSGGGRGSSREAMPSNEFVRRQSGLGTFVIKDDDSLVSRPLMFSFGSFDFRNRALVRVADSDWSRPLSFDALGSSSEVVIPSSSKLADTHLGIEIEPGRGRYSHTRVITFTSRYVVKNMTGIPLQYRTVYNTSSASLLEDGERRPLHTLHRARRRLLTIASASKDSGGKPVADIRAGKWSSPFSIDDIGRVYIRMPVNSSVQESGELLVKVDIIMEGACLFVIMQRKDRYWPYMIENNTRTDIVVWQYMEKQHHSEQRQVGGSSQVGGQQTQVRRSSTAQMSSSPSPSPPPPASHTGADSGSTNAERRQYVIRAGESLDYAWDVPTAQTKMLVISAQGSTRRVNLQEIGEQRPFIYGKPPLPPRRGTGTSALPSTTATAAAAAANRAIVDYTMNVEVVAAGPRQVLRLTSYAPEHSLYTPQLNAIQEANASRIARSSTQQTTATTSSSRRGTSDERFEVVNADERTNFVFRLALEGGIGVSLINKYSSEILFVTLADVELKYTDSTSNQTFKLTVKWVQIDNQIYGAVYPIVLYPTTLGVAMAGVSSPPAIQAVAVRAKDNSYGVEYFKYASVLAQEMSVELDEDFLYALLDFVKFDVPGWGGKDDGVSEEETGTNMLESDIPEIKALDEGQQLYFEFLHIQPFKLNMSFMRTQRLDVGGDPTTARYPAVASAAAAAASGSGGATAAGRGLASLGLPGASDVSEQTGEGVASTPGIVAYAMNVLTMAIGNINEAPVFLNALIMQNVRVSLPILTDRMYKHYSQEVFNQVYKVVGSANFLGNPVGLFNNISSGVSDFFYEPYQGFVMSDRPQDFGFGLARGTASLFKKTVFGMTDSFSKFTDSMSKGLSAATMDPQYQTERSMSRVRNKPKHAIYGVARGAESFAKSVGSGLAGVVMRPLEGAEQEGVGGFFKGVGKGLVGVVTKPVIGMFDLASNVTEGIRNTTTVFERDLDRQRLPRHIGRDGIITVYSSREALGQAWMRELNKGAYAFDNYLAHLELPGSDMVVLLTFQRLVMFRRAKPDEAGMAVGAAGSSAETGNATGAIGVSAANASKAQVEWEQEIKSLHSIQLEATGISLKLPATSEGYVPPGPFIPISDAQSRRWFYDQIREAVKALIDHRKELG
ncbi:Vacuolar protein sorting-associated protein 13 [Coemansia interrupta]|uniref:Vacuolar protein sorting-associated protein 13 n=1 Tax=Coemansia interrupta TaxID=1126814 RepID=A0A9W8HJK5_9FUNG|nr:Vacuolar protein sorting-associated protein 13 [Coemansia interrupta]